MPSFELAAFPAGVTRPLIVAVAHLPILILSIAVLPIWILAMIRPSSHGDYAVRAVRELRTWSRDVVGAVYGVKPR